MPIYSNESGNTDDDDVNIIEDFADVKDFIATIDEAIRFRYEKCATIAEVKAKMAETKKREVERAKIAEFAQLHNLPYVDVSSFENLEELKKWWRKKQADKTKTLIKSAQIPKIYTFVRANDFIINSKNKSTAEIAIKCITDNKGLFIFGECGTGKTMLASIIANERAERNKSSVFIRAVDIFYELNPFFAQDKQAPIRKRTLMQTTPCLIIDDLGAEKPSDFTRATLFDVLDHRMNGNLQTIITTNFNIDQLEQRMNSKEELQLSKKIIRRITSTCQIVELKHF